MDEWGVLGSCRYLIHDRDAKYFRSFRKIIESADVKRLPLPARSPNLNAFAERWVKSVKDECLSKLILFGETSLRRALRENRVHYHGERNHKSKNNILLIEAATKTMNHVDGSASFIGEVECCSAGAKTLACAAQSAPRFSLVTARWRLPGRWRCCSRKLLHRRLTGSSRFAPRAFDPVSSQTRGSATRRENSAPSPSCLPEHKLMAPTRAACYP
jgi:hypothetical protein